MKTVPLSSSRQLRVLEAELSEAEAHRDLLHKVALEAHARQESEEEKAIELEAKSKVFCRRKSKREVTTLLF